MAGATGIPGKPGRAPRRLGRFSIPAIPAAPDDSLGGLGRGKSPRVEKRDDPVSVWRAAYIVWDFRERRPRFQPVGDGQGIHPLYDRCSKMRCPSGHTRPAPSCTCGFYAARGAGDPFELMASGTAARGSSRFALRSALSGRVIEYDEGWRAEHLDVLEVVPSAYCAGPFMPEPLTQGYEAGPAVCPELARGFAVEASGRVTARCVEHLHGQITLTGEELERALRVPVLGFLPGQFGPLPYRTETTTVEIAGQTGDDLARAPGTGALAELIRSCGPGSFVGLDMRDLMIPGNCFSWSLPTRVVYHQLYLMVQTGEGFLRCRWQFDNLTSREFLVPL